MKARLAALRRSARVRLAAAGRVLVRVARGIWSSRYDLFVAAGGAAVAVGIGCIYWPAGIITAGAAVAWWGLLGARTEAAERRAEQRRARGIS